MQTVQTREGQETLQKGEVQMSAAYAALGVQLAAALVKWWGERRKAKAEAKAAKKVALEAGR